VSSWRAAVSLFRYPAIASDAVLETCLGQVVRYITHVPLQDITSEYALNAKEQYQGAALQRGCPQFIGSQSTEQLIYLLYLNMASNKFPILKLHDVHRLT
jgi:hypothetical protein